MAFKDQNSLCLSATRAETVEQYDHAITELSFFRDPSDIIDTLLTDAPDFILGHLLKAYLHMLSTDEDDSQVARTHLELAISHATGDHGNERERWHIQALQQWLDGSMEKASASLDALLISYPQDMLALLIGHQLDFFRGDAWNLKNRMARALPKWDREHPLYGFVLGMYGFGLEEAHEYDKAEQVARQAVELNPRDVWGIHAVAHALEMLNRYDDGVSYMTERRQDWAKDNFFIPHNALHLGLFKLERGELDEIINLSDTMIHNLDTAPNPIVLVDGSSLAWRMYLDNVEFGAQRSEQLITSWQQKMDQNFYSFNDIHAVMAFVAGGDLASAERVINRLRSFLHSGNADTSYFRMTQEVGLPLAEGLVQFGRGNYQEALTTLMPIRQVIHHFGGSHAQRDAFARTLLEAACRAGQADLATALLGERLADRPTSPYNLMKQQQISML